MTDFSSSDESHESDQEEIKAMRLIILEKAILKISFWGSNFENVFFWKSSFENVFKSIFLKVFCKRKIWECIFWGRNH